MTILITGGAGFVGLNIAEQLCDRGDRVVLFGPFPPPSDALTAFRKKPGHVAVAIGDVSVRSDLDAAMETHSVDRVIHGAAITADLAREHRMAREIFMVNLLGTVEVVEAALRHGITRVVDVSTGSVFGEAGNLSESLDEVPSSTGTTCPSLSTTCRLASGGRSRAGANFCRSGSRASNTRSRVLSTTAR